MTKIAKFHWNFFTQKRSNRFETRKIYRFVINQRSSQGPPNTEQQKNQNLTSPISLNSPNSPKCEQTLVQGLWI